jgi:SNF2 family DNA or RNA helicase
VNKLRDIARLLELLEARPTTSNFDTLSPLIKKLVLARTMEQLRSSIPDAPPPHTETTITLPFDTEEESEFYRGISGIIVRRWRALANDGNPLMKIELFLKLRQISLHPQVYIESRQKALGNRYERPDWLESSTKFEAIKGLIRDDPRSHKWIIFCHFHPEMTLLSAALTGQAWIRSVKIYNGTLSQAERTSLLESTHEPLEDGCSDVLLIQLQSGGTGLNLQHFDRIIFTGPWWTAALMQQAIGRAVRIGQREVVKVYYLKLKEEEALNIDAVMIEKAELKRDLCKKVLEDACHSVSEFVIARNSLARS